MSDQGLSQDVALNLSKEHKLNISSIVSGTAYNECEGQSWVCDQGLAQDVVLNL